MAGVELSAGAQPSGSGATAWRKPVRTLLGHLADLLLPPVCISCRTRIGSHGVLWGACFAKIDFIAPPICTRLGVPLPYNAGEPLLSAAAIAKPPVYDRAGAAARYSATMRELIQSFKYRDRHEGLALFGLWLKKAGAELLADADLIVPVPLYRSRLWWRRFNQSAMLAQSLGRLADVPVDCFVLARVRRTSSQVGLSAEQRRRNVAGAFKVPPARAGRVKGKSTVLVDDVITTGATAEACARALKRVGAAKIDVLALARAVEPTAFLL
ncbi:MAG TPA: ComF family protein [Methyloceanibacter sp.]|nr:ComF family protein [Methyloceanibacter sp.]